MGSDGDEDGSGLGWIIPSFSSVDMGGLGLVLGLALGILSELSKCL